MPRGRHRHSQPLHRMMPPLTVAGTAAVLAVISVFAGDTELLRVLAVAIALVAVAGALLARTWDRSAGREVAELTALRTRDEWKTDERVAELETDLEESREIRGRLEKKLRGKRSELARLRSEHADLLRRYATAESERARALEARRRLQREGATAPRIALGTGVAAVGPAAYLKAADALRNLARNAATQQAQRTVEDARRRDAAAADEPQGKHASGSQALPVREHRLVPAATAAAVLPYAQPGRSTAAQAHRAVGGFDFFGTHKSLPAATPVQLAAPAAIPAPAAVPAPAAEPEAVTASAPAATPDHEPAAAEVIDLTAHDDTEQLDVSDLRGAAR
ncbi:hypothetical protein [Streptomyces sp. NBC_00448]|uniref:hypothetical protein n=1 Tax=Streptomyces sp. NBC_00448 TaxID=2903652 RepID=UPI002E1DC22F